MIFNCLPNNPGYYYPGEEENLNIMGKGENGGNKLFLQPAFFH